MRGALMKTNSDFIGSKFQLVFVAHIGNFETHIELDPTAAGVPG